MIINAHLKEFIDTLFVAAQYIGFGLIDFCVCAFLVKHSKHITNYFVKNSDIDDEEAIITVRVILSIIFGVAQLASLLYLVTLHNPNPQR